MYSIAPAKINLFLHIIGKREDGYHLLNSLFAFADFGDKINISDSDRDILNMSGAFSNKIENNDKNLIIKTANLIRKKYNINKYIKIDLEKNIPVGAGIGGGSSDAALTAKLLRSLWNLNLTDEELAELLLPLGADIPACVYGKLTYVTGIGEKIEPLKINKTIAALLVNPMIHVSTSDIFRIGVDAYSPSIEVDDTLLKENDLQKEKDLILWLKDKKNDLEDNAIFLFPEIGELIDVISNINGCKIARMSGSGSTCFGLFNDISEARKAIKIVREIYPHAWIVASEFS